MEVLNTIFTRAAAQPRRIVLAEGEDPRVIEAATLAVAHGIAHVTLLGDVQKIHQLATERALDLANVDVINPTTSPAKEGYANVLYSLRKAKGMSQAQALQAITDPLHFAQMMVREGDADGSVAGAVYTTGDTVRAAIQIIGMAPSSPLVSSFFLMIFDEPFHTVKGGIIFSDCGLVIDPNAEQLANIALSAADSAQNLLDEAPRVAMLSFSTHGSAKHTAVTKVAEATAQVKAQRPEMSIDGEVQLDAAIVPDIAARKVADSQVKGQANVLVFPNLEAGNIGYKLAERIGQGKAIGPILQGLNKPANDLSRGCSAHDVVNVIAITVLQAQLPG